MKKHITLMNFAKYVIPLPPPSSPWRRGRKIVVTPFFARTLVEVEFCFPLQRGRILLLNTISMVSCDVKFCFPLPKGD
jgi:hypothetical protein